MKLLIVSTAPFLYKKGDIYAYSPYVNELALWEKYADKIAFCCPIWEKENGLLVSKLPFQIDYHFKSIDFNLNSFINIIKTFFYGFYNIFVLYRAMLWADHIHLRCPGNVGLLGCFIQVFFPNTPKTAKYAGNWDSKSKQPWTYKLQQWILNNTFLTRNIQVLVYGQWEGSSKNIKPFFTATYVEKDKVPVVPKKLNEVIDFVFVGALVKGKKPMYAIHLIENLYQKGYSVRLRMYGEGVERQSLENYIVLHQLEAIIALNGNQTQAVVKKAYQESHFVILPSESEGWPKAIAEGMFWGCVPLATAVSCVPFMLEQGKRGVLLDLNLEKDCNQIEVILQDQNYFDTIQNMAASWSRKYTLDVFEVEIKHLLTS
jgi:glycosyltransferase involved in cell wall biosynthesis